jgi:NAD-dependent deacetylase
VGANERGLETVASFLRGASSVLFITGAGISADSGLPTYRGIGGLYEDADTPEGIPIEEALSGEMMRRHPAIPWKYIHQIEASARGASFNRAHAILAEAERRFERVWVLTQNVDGLHRLAGSRNVIDIHGDVHQLLCTACEHRATVEDYSHLSPLPLCPDCGAPLRPDVVLFGELLPLAKVETLERELLRGFDVVFSIGTTSVFPYIARPVIEARMRRKPTVEINPGETLISGEVDVKLEMRAAEACEALWSRL